MSWEQRRQEWKENPPDLGKVDEWFNTLSLGERFDAFFDSESFKSMAQELQKYLHVFFESGKPISFRYEPTLRLVSYCLGKITAQTPVFRDMIKNNENVVKLLQKDESRIMRRMYAIFTYEPEKKPGVPEFVYNMSLPWKWEDRLNELLAM